MATRLLPATVQRQRHHCRPPRVSKFNHADSSSSPIFTSLVSLCSRNLFAANCYLRTSSSVDGNLRRSFPSSASNHRTLSGHFHAASSGSPSPPESDPPPGENPDSSSGIMLRLSKIQDAVQIFFAVFFWMSLFFWSCVWDGRNNGRPNKGSRFRK